MNEGRQTNTHPSLDTAALASVQADKRRTCHSHAISKRKPKQKPIQSCEKRSKITSNI
jgi:hypothetical protein